MFLKIRTVMVFTSLLLGVFTTNYAQEVTVSGVITTTDDQSPLPSVSVTIKGENKGVISDFDGNYSITTAAGKSLEFSSLGFVSQTVLVADKTLLNIAMVRDVANLDEVVVTGYTKIDRKKFTGVATRLKMEEIKVAGVSDPSRLLEGRDAGVVVDNVSGSFGASPRIRIRGNTSINGNNNPIWVVDGIILEDNIELDQGALASGNISSLVGSSIAGLNPDDIETFDILKDASATALYGARAKNGVIVITTKKGKEGTLSVSYNSSFAYRLRPRYENFNVLNSQDELGVYKELFDKGWLDFADSQSVEAYGVIGKYFVDRGIKTAPIGINGNTLSDSYFSRYQQANTDWFKVLFNDFSLQQTHSFSMNGGTDKATYFFSASYLNDDGQTLASGVDRYTARLNTRFVLSDKLSIRTMLHGNFRDQQAPGTNNRKLNALTGEYQREFDINPYSYALSSSRSVTPYDENGNLEFFRKNYAPFNIIHELNNNFININVTDLTFQTDLDFDLSSNMVLNSTFNVRRAITQREHIIGDDSNQAEAFRADDGVLLNNNPFLYQDPNQLTKPPFSILPEGGINIFNEDVLNYGYIRNSLNWSPQLNDDNTFNFLVGQELKSSVRTSREYNGRGIIYDEGFVVNTNPDAIRQLTQEGDQYFGINNFKDRFVGFFFNAGYTHKGKYTLGGTVRYDGSNQQGRSTSARYLTSYNVSGAWNIHQEDFFKPDWIDLLKLKATYGLTGGRGPKTSASLDLVGAVPLRPQDVEAVIRIRGLENNDLTFEKLKEFSVGLEYAIFNSRIAGELGYYRRNSFDLIGKVLTSGIGGSGVNEEESDVLNDGFKNGNFADLKINGYEFSISTVNIKTDSFKWTSNFNIGYNTEEITNLKSSPRLVDLLKRQGHPYIGNEISALYSTRFARLNEFGIPTFFDENGDQVLNLDLQKTSDIEKILVYEGPTQPRGAGGFGNTFTYKNWSLSANISFKFDYKIRLDSDFDSDYNDFSALPGELVNRWRLPGDENITNIPSIVEPRTRIGSLSNGSLNAYALYNSSNLRVADGSYARLRSIGLGYALPGDYVKSLGLSDIKFRLQGENLALLYSSSKLGGQDPEFFNTGGAALPLAKTITFSLNVGF